MCMSEKETSEISKRLDTIEKMIIQSRDMPQSETMSNRNQKAIISLKD